MSLFERRWADAAGSLVEKTVDRCVGVYFAGAKNSRGETGVIHRVRIVLGFQTEGRVLVKDPAPGTANTIKVVAGIQLDRGFGCGKLYTPAAGRIHDPGDGLQAIALPVCEETVIVAHGKLIIDQQLFFKEYVGKHNSDYREKYLEEALYLIKNHYSETITAKDVAEYMKISESSFAKLFKNKTGYTFLKYLTLYRMKNSIELLSDKNRRACEVANLVGYKDYRYFCEVFKKYLGITPFEYRKGHY